MLFHIGLRGSAEIDLHEFVSERGAVQEQMETFRGVGLPVCFNDLFLIGHNAFLLTNTNVRASSGFGQPRLA